MRKQLPVMIELGLKGVIQVHVYPSMNEMYR